ncbi:MAG: endolytic transglycosylase MltG [Candidatus Saganbacteria bacterium]|nr:endolytic transglycosylase MltG [Candidatus Saganbacteria bacterium]
MTLLVVIAALFLGSLFQAGNSFDNQYCRVTIDRGDSTFDVQKKLEHQGILKPYSTFAFAARLLGLSRQLQAGEYEFSPSEKLLTVLLRLKRGDVVEPEIRRVKITFPEGTSIYKMGEILRKNNVSDPDKFQQLVKEGITEGLRKEHWVIFKYLPTESLEGFLYPDTYWFYENATVDQIVEAMVSRFEEMVLPFWDKAKADTKYTLFEILTLASIVEKEAADPKERPIISSVFHNRLNIKMALDSCSTIKYALERPTKIVYYDQLEVDSPYNTYKNRGLPPGPICNPGIDSIKAAVYPAKTKYFYFVAKNDGSHIFSKTFAEHQRARAKALGR